MLSYYESLQDRAEQLGFPSGWRPKRHASPVVSAKEASLLMESLMPRPTSRCLDLWLCPCLVA
jgi:hypothetical protein